MFEFVETPAPNAVIKVIGVGGGGGNAVAHMVNAGVEGVEFICANTDAQALRNCPAKTTIQLGGMKDTSTAAPSQLDTRLFVEETGTATVARLQATDEAARATLDAGDLVDLQVQGNAVNVLTVTGTYIGMVEPRIGLRLSKMMTAGNQYTAAMVTTEGALKVILRETFKHPSMIDKVSFPAGRSTEVRAYTRKGLLRRDDDEDYAEYGDDEVVEEESDDGWSESDGDEFRDSALR